MLNITHYQRNANQNLKHMILKRILKQANRASLMWLRGKESACNTGDSGSIPGLGRSHVPRSK